MSTWCNMIDEGYGGWEYGRRSVNEPGRREIEFMVVFECTGIESSVCSAAYMVRRGGVLMVVGVGRSIMNNLPFMHLSLAEVCNRCDIWKTC